jgi:hypothetical protein
VAALDRQQAADLTPGSFPMSVLVQPALSATAGGTAQVDDDGMVVVHGVKGSPAPMLQGWSTGHEARFDGSWIGEELIEILGLPALDGIARLIADARHRIGASRCEWAVDGQLWALQLGPRAAPVSRPRIALQGSVDPDLVRIARTVVMAPGRLGSILVLPWALGGIPQAEDVPVDRSKSTIESLHRLCRELTAEVWEMPQDQAMAAARKCMAGLRGPNPRTALDRIRQLRAPDRRRAGRLLSRLAGIRLDMTEMGVAADPTAAWHLSEGQVAAALRGERAPAPTRVGLGRWEPFLASVVLASGTEHRGVPASSGIGAGIRYHCGHPSDRARFPARSVLTAPQPVPGLAPWLWDAAGLVTETGSPEAHLFESSRALGVAAVSGVDLPGGAAQIVAVDGHAGVVSTLPVRESTDA